MDSIVKKLVVLGSTGSIGRQSLDIVRALPDRLEVFGLAANNNLSLLTEQVREFKPRYVCYSSDSSSVELMASLITDTGVEFLPVDEIVCHPEVDTVVIAVSGNAGLVPTLAAIKSGKNIALANKESLVMAGEIITREAVLNKAKILPIDSEHSAIWQCINGDGRDVAQLVLTASGGPFYHYSPTRLATVTPEQALKHPSWQMGKKITIDSATLMNKGLEVIEAHWLFHMPFDNIRVLIHPQSIVHSMVEFIDGSLRAQLSYPDMRLPIQYALTYPERLHNPQIPRLKLSQISQLTFEEPDTDTFPCLRLAIDAGEKGGTYPAVLCGADEAAVELFLTKRIKFTNIPRLIEQVLEELENKVNPTLDDILAADNWARERVIQIVSGDHL